jgi:NAD dependent epimerase/dehydratase family enzyme
VKVAAGELADYLLHGRRVIPARLRSLDFPWKHASLTSALTSALSEPS